MRITVEIKLTVPPRLLCLE